MLSIAVEQTLSKYMEALLGPIFACGLSESLTQALVDMAHYIPPIKPLIQERLLDMLSLVLCGQPQLKTVLGREDQESVARRIHHYACLRLLSRDELTEYVQHRCAIAGCKKLPFDAGALEALHEISRGNLRAADGLALTALERAALSKKTVVGAQHVAEARQELYP